MIVLVSVCTAWVAAVLSRNLAVGLIAGVVHLTLLSEQRYEFRTVAIAGFVISFMAGIVGSYEAHPFGPR